MAGAALGGALSLPALAQNKILLRISSPASPSDQRAIGLVEKFGSAIRDFARGIPHACSGRVPEFECQGGRSSACPSSQVAYEGRTARSVRSRAGPSCWD